MIGQGRPEWGCATGPGAGWGGRYLRGLRLRSLYLTAYVQLATHYLA